MVSDVMELNATKSNVIGMDVMEDDVIGLM
jgi:hypothetical protein